VLQPQLEICGLKLVTEFKDEDCGLRFAPVYKCFHLRGHASEAGGETKQKSVAFGKNVFGVAKVAGVGGGRGVKHSELGIGGARGVFANLWSTVGCAACVGVSAFNKRLLVVQCLQKVGLGVTLGGACIFSRTEACRVSGTCWYDGQRPMLESDVLSSTQYLVNGNLVARGLMQGECEEAWCTGATAGDSKRKWKGATHGDGGGHFFGHLDDVPVAVRKT